MKYEIKNSKLSLAADSLGGQLTSIRSGETEYIWQGDPNSWKGQAPFLFPYIARLTDGKYTYRGKTYEMRIHGFAKYREMFVRSQQEDSITFGLSADKETLQQYPFLFDLSLTYALEGSKVIVTYKVENKDEKTMYFGIGGHPGFNVPMEKGLAFEDYSLTFGEPSAPKQVGFTENCFLNGEFTDFPLEENGLKLRHDLFDHDAIVLKDMAKSITISSAKGTKSVTVSYPDMKYLGLWHWPKAAVNYVCIEPWSSLPSRDGIVEDLETQENLISLEPGKTYTNIWTIEIR